MTSSKIAALIVAGGVGERMGGRVPKQYWNLGGLTVISRTIRAFMACDFIEDVWVVIHPDHRQMFEDSCGTLAMRGVVEGGATRQDSVRAGLLAMEGQCPDYVLIHDAVRPFASYPLIERVTAKLSQNKCIIPAVRVTDTLKQVDDSEVQQTVDRENLVAVQTPQGFDFKQILSAHQSFKGNDYTDDAALIEQTGGSVEWVEGDVRNMKLTTSHDWHQARLMVDMGMEVRTGIGYDVHALIDHDPATPREERTIRLAGMDIPHTQQLQGHSDADVVLHAIVDALLGAMGRGDIGQHFPPSNQEFRGKDSSFFVTEVCKLLAQMGGNINNIDVTLICEAPHISKYRSEMVLRMAGMLGIEKNRVNLKATTTEKLGFTGRREGIASEAVASIMIPK